MKIEIDLEQYPLYEKALAELAERSGKDPAELAEDLLFTALIEKHKEEFGTWT